MSNLLTVCLLLTLACSAWGQPTVGTPVTNTHDGPNTTVTLAGVVISAGNPGIAVCALGSAADGSGLITGITFNGSEAFSLIDGNSTATLDLELWYLASPTVTTADVVVTYAGTSNKSAIATALPLTGVAQANPTLSNNGSCSTCTSNPLNLTTVVDNTLLITCAKHNNQTVTFTHGSGQVPTSDIGSSGGGGPGERQSSSYELKVATGLETLESIASASGSVGYVVMGVEPAAAGGSGRRRMAPTGFR